MGPFAAIDKPELLELPDHLVGDRVELRAYRPGDGVAMFAGISAHRDELLQWMAWPSNHQAIENSEVYVRRMAADYLVRKSLTMSIWSRADGAFLGGTGFHATDWATPKAEIGYFLLPTARGRGYACEAVKLLIGFGFEHAHLNRVFGQCDAANAASIKVMQSAGMRQEACLRNDGRDHHGQLRDTLVFALTAADWPLTSE